MTTTATSSVWTDVRIEQLKGLFAEGYSTSKIGGAMGVTRNSIIGKLHRLGLSNPRPRITTGRSPRSESVKGLRDPVIRIRYRPEYVSPAEPAIVIPLCVELVDLEPHQCRYPYGDGPFTFCGHQKQPGSSYCPTHFSLTWQPLRGRT